VTKEKSFKTLKSRTFRISSTDSQVVIRQLKTKGRRKIIGAVTFQLTAF